MADGRFFSVPLKDSASGPTGGFARLVPELHVNDLARSLAFWRDLCGFKIAFEREEEKFVFLEREGAQLMLCQRHGRYETGAMNQPLGQGAMFQVYLDDIGALAATLAAQWRLYEGLSERWYRAGNRENGLRQFIVQDPDGYLVMFAQSLGSRPA